MDKSFDWKKELTERERFISWTSLLVGIGLGALIVIAIIFCVWISGMP